MVGKVRFEARIQELVENIPDLAVLVEPLLIVRRVLREQTSRLRPATSVFDQAVYFAVPTLEIAISTQAASAWTISVPSIGRPPSAARTLGGTIMLNDSMIWNRGASPVGAVVEFGAHALFRSILGSSTGLARRHACSKEPLENTNAVRV
jgi:hypothetical protein